MGTKFNYVVKFVGKKLTLPDCSSYATDFFRVTSSSASDLRVWGYVLSEESHKVKVIQVPCTYINPFGLG